MRKTIASICIVILSAACAPKYFAQESDKVEEAPKATAKSPDGPAHFYHLDFAVREVGPDGKAINSRSYTTTVSTNNHEMFSIRANSRIPVATGGSSSGVSSSLINTSFQYIDVGVRIDAREAHEIARQLSFNLIADVSSVAPSSDPNLHQPITRQNNWQASILTPIGKPTVVFTSDILDSKNSMQVMVTATPIQ